MEPKSQVLTRWKTQDGYLPVNGPTTMVLADGSYFFQYLEKSTLDKINSAGGMRCERIHEGLADREKATVTSGPFQIKLQGNKN